MQHFAHDLTPNRSLEALRGVMTWHSPAWTPLPEHTHTHPSPLWCPLLWVSSSPVSFFPLGHASLPAAEGGTPTSGHSHLPFTPAQCSFHGHHSTRSLKPGIHRLSIYFLSQPSLISFMLSCFSCVWLFATLWTTACQAPLSGSLQDTVHRIFYRTCHGDLY